MNLRKHIQATFHNKTNFFKHIFVLYASFLNYYDSHIIKMFSVVTFSTQLSTFPTTNSHKVGDASFKWQCIHLLYTQKKIVVETIFSLGNC